jgi:benzoyl-CoA reductase/2-hydroxyglutaryl-CoA dehydratase subunit BcrC/BadD/HgdB
MSALDALADELLAAPLSPARARAAAGQRVIGTVGADVPLELITAAGAFPLQLPAIAGQPTPLAERYLESAFEPVTRSLLQQWLAGAFDFIDTVVLSRANDGVQRLYYYLCELQRRGTLAGPRLLLYDLAKLERSSSAAYSEAATRRLAAQLGSDASALPAAIAQRNQRRHLFAQLTQLREGNAAPVGSHVSRWSRAADLGAAPEFDEALAAELTRSVPARGGARLMIGGSSPPDERLHRAVEAAGGCVVDEFGDHSLARLGAAVAIDADALAALAGHYHALHFGPRSVEDHAEALRQRALACHADGVILWLIEQDEAFVWNVPAMQHALADLSLPMLTLTRRQWQADDGALESILAFTTQLRSRP